KEVTKCPNCKKVVGAIKHSGHVNYKMYNTIILRWTKTPNFKAEPRIESVSVNGIYGKTV
ncbi:40153_t:CDS:2, partial [Gigaspora margarita]